MLVTTVYWWVSLDVILLFVGDRISLFVFFWYLFQALTFNDVGDENGQSRLQHGQQHMLSSTSFIDMDKHEPHTMTVFEPFDQKLGFQTPDQYFYLRK